MYFYAKKNNNRLCWCTCLVRQKTCFTLCCAVTCLCWRPKTIFLSCPSTGALLPMQLLYDRFVIVLQQQQVELQQYMVCENSHGIITLDVYFLGGRLLKLYYILLQVWLWSFLQDATKLTFFVHFPQLSLMLYQTMNKGI